MSGTVGKFLNNLTITTNNGVGVRIYFSKFLSTVPSSNLRKKKTRLFYLLDRTAAVMHGYLFVVIALEMIG